MMDNLKKTDPAVFDSIVSEARRQADGLELIASENFVSQAVLEAMGTVMTNKYAEGLPSKRYYGGCEFVDVAEDLARDRARQLFGAEHVNVQPYSGSPANQAVSINPELEYAVVQVDGENGPERLFLAEALLKDSMDKWGFENYRVIAYGRGDQFELIRLQHPFYEA